MSGVTLGPVLVAGAWRVAALTDSHVAAYSVGARIAGHGGKEPLAVLVAGPAGIAAFRPTGEALDRADIEALLPGAWAAFADSVPEGPDEW